MAFEATPLTPNASGSGGVISTTYCTMEQEQVVEPETILHFDRNATTVFHFILVIGASGDVAKRKIYPALFELYNHNLLNQSSPSSKVGQTVRIQGFARSKLTSVQFRNQIKYDCQQVSLAFLQRQTNPIFLLFI